MADHSITLQDPEVLKQKWQAFVDDLAAIGVKPPIVLHDEMVFEECPNEKFREVLSISLRHGMWFRG